MAESITLEKVYSKVSRLEEKLSRLEKRLVVPEVTLGKKEQDAIIDEYIKKLATGS